MSQKNFVVHNRGLSQILFSTQWSLRSIFKHLLVIAYVVLITLMLFKFDGFKQTFKSITGEKEFSLSSLSALVPKIAWILLLIFLEILFLKLSIKMLQLSNRNTLIFIPFALITLGLGIFTFLFLPDWMFAKIDSAGSIFDMLKVFATYSYIFLMLPGVAIIWLMANAINERRVSPFVSTSNIFNIISLCVWTITFGTFYWLLKIFVLVPNVDLNGILEKLIQSKLNMFLAISFIILIFSSPVLSWKINKDMKKRTNYKFFDKNIVQATVVVMILPIAIWQAWSLGNQKSHWVEWMFIGIVCLCMLIAFGFSFIKRTEAASPKIFMVLISLLLVLIWMSKYFFEYFWGYAVNAELTMPIALIGTGALMLVVYFKSPMVSNRISFLFLKFMETLWTIILVMWVSSFIPSDLNSLLEKIFPKIRSGLSLASMSMPIFALVVTLLYWYITQWKIKNYSVMKIRTLNKRQIKKQEVKEEKNNIKKMNKYKEQKNKIKQLKNDKLNRKTNKKKRKEVLNV